MTVIPFGAAFPGLVISTIFLVFALIDFGVAWTAVEGNATLAPAFFGTQLPVVNEIKGVLPLSMPMLIIRLVKEDVLGLASGVNVAKALGAMPAPIARPMWHAYAGVVQLATICMLVNLSG